MRHFGQFVGGAFPVRSICQVRIPFRGLLRRESSRRRRLVLLDRRSLLVAGVENVVLLVGHEAVRHVVRVAEADGLGIAEDLVVTSNRGFLWHNLLADQRWFRGTLARTYRFRFVNLDLRLLGLLLLGLLLLDLWLL